MRVAILTRVSTAEQAEADRLSLDAQERAMREKCARLGWTVVSVFTATLGDTSLQWSVGSALVTSASG